MEHAKYDFHVIFGILFTAFANDHILAGRHNGHLTGYEIEPGYEHPQSLSADAVRNKCVKPSASVFKIK